MIPRLQLAIDVLLTDERTPLAPDIVAVNVKALSEVEEELERHRQLACMARELIPSFPDDYRFRLLADRLRELSVKGATT